MAERSRGRGAALASTLIIGSQSYPLLAPLEVVDTWTDGFEKVWTALLRRGGTLDVDGAKALAPRGIE